MAKPEEHACGYAEALGYVTCDKCRETEKRPQKLKGEDHSRNRMYFVLTSEQAALG